MHRSDLVRGWVERGARQYSVLCEAEDKDWRVKKGSKYFKMLCPNKCQCFKTVKLTPSDPNYLRNLQGQLRRAACWDSEEPK